VAIKRLTVRLMQLGPGLLTREGWVVIPTCEASPNRSAQTEVNQLDPCWPIFGHGQSQMS
jgi:hypothetical protein